MSLQGVCIAVGIIVNRKQMIVSFRTDFRSSYIMNSTIAGIEASDTNKQESIPSFFLPC